MREVRRSPDGNAVAIRTDSESGNFNAWAIMNAIAGGHYAPSAEVQTWIPWPDGE